MKKIVAGVVAHVDAGKTTLSEALLYRGGTQRQLGRVDNGTLFLIRTPLKSNAESLSFRIKQASLMTISTSPCSILQDTLILRGKLNRCSPFSTTLF